MSWRARMLGVLPRRARLPVRYSYERRFRHLGAEMAVLRRLVRPGSTAVDVGAGVGLYSYGFAKFCARVEAFEPNPQSAAIIRAHGHKRIAVHPEALSSEAGTTDLFLPSDKAGTHPSAVTLERRDGSGQRIKVTTATLDSFAFTDVSLLKIDVEGHERKVLRGARELLRRERPVLMVEVEQRHLDVPIMDVLDEIVGFGYEGQFLDGSRLVPLQEFDVQRHQAVDLGVLASSYLNNFFFTPTDG